MSESGRVSSPKRGPYTVGQRVWIYSRNGRGQGPVEGVVTKVGRTLVSVVEARYPSWKPETYRIDCGYRSDNYGHKWIRTEEERLYLDRESAAQERLRDLGIRFDIGSRVFSIEVLEAMADLIETMIAPASTQS